MDGNQFKKNAAAAIDESKYTYCNIHIHTNTKLVVNYYDTLPERRVVSNVEPGYLKKLLPDGPPQTGEKWSDIQADIETKIVPGLTHWQSPNFMAFFPANATYASMLGELYSAAFTAPAFNWICSPAVTELETIVLDWLCKLLNLPDVFLSTGEGGGVIQGSASEAVVTVMVAARDKYLRETTSHLSGDELEDVIAHKRSRLVALGSDQAHSSTQKAALICGVRYRTVPTNKDNDYSLTSEALLETIEECKAKGLEPFFLTCNLGTTSTCAVDNFGSVASAISTLSPGQPGEPGEIWIHVDAAYAGAALVCPEFQHHTAAFDKFHSFDMNMHKWLLTNFDASCLFVRRRKDLIDALSITPSYLRNEHSESGLVTDYRDWQIPLGRRFRALKIWFVMRTYGIGGLQEHIRSHIELGKIFSDLVEGRQDLFTIFTKPAFALTVFTCNADDLEKRNKLTKEVYELVNKRGEIYITSSVVGGVYAIRVVSANPQAEEKYVRRAFDIIVQATEDVLAGNGGTGDSTPKSLVEESGGKGLGEAKVVKKHTS